MLITLKRFIFLSFLLFIVGSAAIGISALMGWDPLDGIAGGPTTNTTTENVLASFGAITGIAGIILILGGVIVWIFKRLRQKPLIRMVVLSIITVGLLFGSGLVFHNLGLIDIPFFRLSGDYHDTYAQENQVKAQQIKFQIFKLGYSPDYISTRRRINTVYAHNNDHDSARLDEDRSLPLVQFNTDFHAKLAKNTHVSDNVITLVQYKPRVDINLENSPNGCCTSSYPLKDFTLIGANKDNGKIHRALDGHEVLYLTDYKDTRIVLRHLNIGTDRYGQPSPLTDSEAIKILGGLQPLEISDIDFTP